jgi:hypothetical protein
MDQIRWAPQQLKSLLYQRQVDIATRLNARGQGLVELALILPIALLLVAGAIDAGRLFFARVSIENAAREGAVFAMGNPLCDTAARAACVDPNTADWHVRNEASGLGPLVTSYSCYTYVAGSGTWVAQSITDCADGDKYEVEVSTEFSFLMPILAPILGETIDLRASASSIVLNEAYDPTATPIPWPTPTPTPTPPPCAVPDMIDLTLLEAEAAWEAAGFDPKGLSTEPNNMRDDDIVLDQEPAADEELSCADGEAMVFDRA